MKIVTIIGARPQFIKAAAVSRAIRSQAAIAEVLVHTGQHFDPNMSDVFFEDLEIPCPDYHLGIHSLSHGAMTGRMLEGIEALLLKEKPDWTLVYGDTNSTLAGALASAKLHIPCAHVEAGLRSFNRSMPEEINRILADQVSDILFAPTRAAVRNLRREGISEDRIRLVGDVMYDAALYYGTRADARSRILERCRLDAKKYILATVHRAENTDDPFRLRAVLEGLARMAQEIPVVLPLHPRTRAAFEREQLYERARQSLMLLEPVGYLDMIMLEKNARLIATDSGGVQKEAYFYRVPCVTLRRETEWVELVETGWNYLVSPTDGRAVASAIRSRLDHNASECSLYGTGQAAQAVVMELLGKPANNGNLSFPVSTSGRANTARVESL